MTFEDQIVCPKNNTPGRCFRLPETGGSRWKESGNILDPIGQYRNNNRKMEAVFRSKHQRVAIGFIRK